jgi:tripartite-type tricarboxylate transporter receptor subunit TctC
MDNAMLRIYRPPPIFAAATMFSASLLVFAGPAIAAEWSPTKPVRMIVGFPPGGATDLVGRILQPKLSAALGKQIIIDNRPGANGLISMEILKNAEPDGHTVGLSHIGTFIISPAIQKVPYDTRTDFAPIGLMVSLQNIIVTHPSVAAKNLHEYIALAKAKPGVMQYATSGVGSPGHLAASLFESMTGVQLTHVPYKGGGPAITDLLGGHVLSGFSVISTVVPLVQSGKLRGIAVTSTRRADAVPDVPTIAEAGVKGYAATNWYGLHAPAKTSPQIIERLNKELVAALKSPDIVQQLKDRGIDATPTSPADYAKFIRDEEAKWLPVIRKANIQL